MFHLLMRRLSEFYSKFFGGKFFFGRGDKLCPQTYNIKLFELLWFELWNMNLIIFLETSYEFLTNFLLLFNFLHLKHPMNFLWAYYKLVMYFSYTSYKCLTNILWTSCKLLKNFLQTSYELLISYELLTNFLWIWHKHPTNIVSFSQASYELLTNSLQTSYKPPYKLLTNHLTD